MCTMMDLKLMGSLLACALQAGAAAAGQQRVSAAAS
jgi:hypothetical protein